MSGGTGTSFQQSYTPEAGGIMSHPFPSNIGGNPWIYENGGSAGSLNYEPMSGGRRRKTGSYKKKNTRRIGKLMKKNKHNKRKTKYSKR
jgi:hypothetical protein